MNLFQFTVVSLNTAAFVYLAACFAYFILVARDGGDSKSIWAKIAATLAIAGFVLHTSGMIGRWVIGGLDRPPWTNLYESLVFFAWGVSLFQVITIARRKLPIIGIFASPLIFILMGMSVMTANKSVEPLIPALQSYWLKIHVVFGMLSYAGFTTAGCFAFLQLLKNRVSMSKIGAGIVFLIVMNLCICGGRYAFSQGKFEMAKTVLRTMPDGSEVQVKDQYRESEDGPVITRMEEVPYGNVPFFLAIALFLAAGGVFVATARKHPPGTKAAGNDLPSLGVKLFIAGMVVVAALYGVIALGVHNSATLSLHSNPYLMTLLTMTWFVALVFLTIHYRYEVFMRALPPAERLDELSYKNIMFAFPFQTLLLITGAVWAYYAWGRSWGWDPKETWAFITWVAFLIYLHGKMLMNWKANTLSVLALAGFVILVFAFLGVNLVLSGLHSYGAA